MDVGGGNGQAGEVTIHPPRLSEQRNEMWTFAAVPRGQFLAGRELSVMLAVLIGGTAHNSGIPPRLTRVPLMVTI